jgi:lysophospholipase L1-like esterase
MQLIGKKVVFLGDSITQGSGASEQGKCYVSLFAAAHPEAEVINLGIGGTRLANQIGTYNEYYDTNPFYTRISKIPQDADLICVFGGTNDYGHGDAPMGSFGDDTYATYYGACYALLRDLQLTVPNAKIVVCTPIHREGESNPATRSDGKWILKDYVTALKQTAEYFALPVLDLWSVSGIQPCVPFLKERLAPDGLHPNDVGHALLCEKFDAFIKTL